MTIELIIGIVGVALSVIVGLTSARKDSVQTILAMLDAIKTEYNELLEKYEALDTKYKLLLEENVELRAAMESAGYDFPDGHVPVAQGVGP